MSDEDWSSSKVQSFAMFLNGEGIACADNQGSRVTDDSFYLVFNPHHEKMAFVMPHESWGMRWVKVLDTNEDLPTEGNETANAGDSLEVEARSVLVLRRLP